MYAANMHRVWSSIIEPLLIARKPEVIVEIGIGDGSNTRNLLAFCAKYGSTLHGIDPAPSCDVEALIHSAGQEYTYHRKRSLEILPTIVHADAILIDGDHNWYTVFHELQAIDAMRVHPSCLPLVLLHDVSWPYGRRDMYHDPISIPEIYRQPWKRGGLSPDTEANPHEEGINRWAMHATKEGGSRNGVRTAVEDFLESSSSWEWHMVPGMHGIGILFPKECRNTHPDLCATIDHFCGSAPMEEHIQRIEEDRLLWQCQAERHAGYADRLRLRCEKLLSQEVALKRMRDGYITIWHGLWNKLVYAEQQRDLSMEERDRVREERDRVREERDRVRSEKDHIIERLQDTVCGLQRDADRLRSTKSWRWTSFLRNGEYLAQRIMGMRGGKTIAPVAQLSAPTNAASVQRSSIEHMQDADCPTPDVAATNTCADVAVIITCHNYGRFLSEAIESVLQQSPRPRDILVVDDASQDETMNIAQQYGAAGVRLLQGNWDCIASARNAGAQVTEGEYLLFLDADDKLADGYIAKTLAAMEDPSIAIAYGDMEHFGEETALRTMPPYNREHLQRVNTISSHALMRRQVFECAGGYRALPNEDWDLYRRMLQPPLQGQKVNTRVLYRVHAESRSKRYHRSKPSYCHQANLLHEPITIFTPFAGRREYLDLFTESLTNLQCDRERMQVHWYDTSSDRAFSEKLRHALTTLPFGHVSYTSAPHPEMWNHTAGSLLRDRVSNAQNAQYYYELAVVRAYNHLLRTCATDWVLTIEDDILPVPDVLHRLLQAVTPETVAVVAPYRCPRAGHFLVWKLDDDGKPVFQNHSGAGVEEVAGSGFGCSLFRVSALKKMPIMTKVWTQPPEWYDHIAFKNLRAQGKILCVWDAAVRHLSAEHTTPITVTA